jgi:hypothetical protein
MVANLPTLKSRRKTDAAAEMMVVDRFPLKKSKILMRFNRTNVDVDHDAVERNGILKALRHVFDTESADTNKSTELERSSAKKQSFTTSKNRPLVEDASDGKRAWHFSVDIQSCDVPCSHQESSSCAPVPDYMPGYRKKKDGHSLLIRPELQYAAAVRYVTAVPQQCFGPLTLYQTAQIAGTRSRQSDTARQLSAAQRQVQHNLQYAHNKRDPDPIFPFFLPAKAGGSALASAWPR